MFIVNHGITCITNSTGDKKPSNLEKATLLLDVIGALGAFVFVSLAINEVFPDLEPLKERDLTILIATPGGVVILDSILLAYKYKNMTKSIAESDSALSALKTSASAKEKTIDKHEEVIGRQKETIATQQASIAQLTQELALAVQQHKAEMDNLDATISKLQDELAEAKSRAAAEQKALEEEAEARIQAMQLEQAATKASLIQMQAVGRMHRMQPVTDGYGEYIVFKKTGELSQALYDQAYSIIDRHIKNRERMEGSLSSILLTELRELDDDIEITFIPRTLYDMMLIKKAIQEEEKNGKPCRNHGLATTHLLYQSAHNPFSMESDVKDEEGRGAAAKQEQCEQPYCWHSCHFNENIPHSSQESALRTIAFRLNQEMITEICPTGFLSLERIHEITNEQITFFHEFHDRFNAKLRSRELNLGDLGARALSYHFAGHTLRGLQSSFNMKITEERTTTVLRNAVDLECSLRAQNAVILYRGGSLAENGFDGKNRICFGLSPLEGAFHDGGATVLYYTVGEKRETYAIVIPYRDLAEAPYYAPNDRALENMYGQGEYFHAGTKIAIEGQSEGHVDGIFGELNQVAVRPFLSFQTSEQLTPLFTKWQSTLISLDQT